MIYKGWDDKNVCFTISEIHLKDADHRELEQNLKHVLVHACIHTHTHTYTNLH